MRVGELGYALGHEHVFEFLQVHFSLDFIEYGIRRQLINASAVAFAQGFDFVVGRWRIGLNIAAGQGLDVFVRPVFWLLRPCGGEDNFLLKLQVLVLPVLLVGLPYTLNVGNTDKALGGVA